MSKRSEITHSHLDFSVSPSVKSSVKSCIGWYYKIIWYCYPILNTIKHIRCWKQNKKKYAMIKQHKNNENGTESFIKHESVKNIFYIYIAKCITFI